jgi:hypothetical protein
MRNVSNSCRENQNTHFMFKNFPPKIMLFMSTVEKYCGAGQATIDSMAHALCMLDAYGYKHTFRICNTYCFSTATMVT